MIRSTLVIRSILIVELVVMVVLMGWAAATDSQTMDEAVHLSAGYSALVTHDFRLNPEHPPLIKLLSAVPLLFLRPNLPLNHESWQQRNEWEFGRQFLYFNRSSATQILFIGRLANIALSAVLVVVIFLVAQRLFGQTGGLAAATLAAFDPNILAHGHLVTTDIGITLLFFVTIIYFARFFQSPSRPRFFWFLLFFAAAQMSKFSAVVLIPITVSMLWLWLWTQKRRLKDWWKPTIKLLLAEALAIIIAALAIYGWSFQRIGADPRISQLYVERAKFVAENKLSNQPALTQWVVKTTDPNSQLGAKIKNLADNARVPLYPFFRGMFAILSHNYGGHLSYLLGRYSEIGWWYYFPVAFAVKTTSATLLLLVLAAIAFIRFFRSRYKGVIGPKRFYRIINTLRSLPFVWYWIIVPPALFFLISLTSHINLGIRHILPIYPFIYIFIAQLSVAAVTRYKAFFKTLFSALIILSITEGLLASPYYLSFFNGLSGGPKSGSKYLVDSNIDWGQDLKRLSRKLTQQKIQDVALKYFGTADVASVLPRAEMLPTSQEIGKIKNFREVAAISVTSLLSRDGEYAWLKSQKIWQRIGYSIYVYDFRATPPEIN